MIYKRQVVIKCQVCKKDATTTMTFGENQKYPDDFFIECPNPNCDNWEEGSLPTQSFNVLSETHISP